MRAPTVKIWCRIRNAITVPKITRKYGPFTAVKMPFITASIPKKHCKQIRFSQPGIEKTICDFLSSFNTFTGNDMNNDVTIGDCKIA
jgi:hypothetical protein